MPAIITAELPDSADAVVLITELEALLDPLYPRESRHGLSVDKLLAEAVAFFLLRLDGTSAACGGVKLFGSEYGELKRMYVRPQFRGLGFARLMLDHLITRIMRCRIQTPFRLRQHGTCHFIVFRFCARRAQKRNTKGR